jgi:hypothetical protein
MARLGENLNLSVFSYTEMWMWVKSGAMIQLQNAQLPTKEEEHVRL